LTFEMRLIICALAFLALWPILSVIIVAYDFWHPD
jgi:hypothetical protein